MSTFYKSELTLKLVKNHLNIDMGFIDDDSYLLQLMEAAQNIILLKINRTFEDLADANACIYRDVSIKSQCLYNLTCASDFWGSEHNGYICPVSCTKRNRKYYYEPALLQAILFVIAHFYASREPVTESSINKIPYTLDYLLESYKYYG